MYMGRVITSPEAEVLRELEGARVLITGLSAEAGVDLARTFADLKARLVVHTSDLSPTMTEVFALLSQGAREIRLYTSEIATAEAATAFAQTSSQVFGGLDAVINLTEFTAADYAAAACDDRVEDVVTARLSPLAHMTRVVANRMRLVFSEGLILNILKTATPRNGREAAIASVVRSALAAMTAGEAKAWEGQGIRINAVGPRSMTDDRTAGACLSNEPDIAALALYLASRRGRSLSGLVFDAD
jgi:3-oxoacyl-[acyl-carrier protein] reductase